MVWYLGYVETNKQPPTMLYNIRIELRDGVVMKFQRKSNIKPLNCVKLNDKIANEIFPREWKEITSTPVY